MVGAAVQGLGGMPEYESRFEEQREKITTASQSITEEALVSVFAGDEATREALLQVYPDSDRFQVHVLGGATTPAKLLDGTNDLRQRAIEQLGRLQA